MLKRTSGLLTRTAASAAILVSSTVFAVDLELQQRFNQDLLNRFTSMSYKGQLRDVDVKQSIAQFAGALQLEVKAENNYRQELLKSAPIPSIQSDRVEKRFAYRINQTVTDLSCHEVEDLFEQGTAVWGRLLAILERAAQIDASTMSDDRYLEVTAQLQADAAALEQKYADLGLEAIDSETVEQYYSASIQDLLRVDTGLPEGSRIITKFRYVDGIELEHFYWQGLEFHRGDGAVALPPGIAVSTKARNLILKRKTSLVGACLSEKSLVLELDIDIATFVKYEATLAGVCRPVLPIRDPIWEPPTLPPIRPVVPTRDDLWTTFDPNRIDPIEIPSELNPGRGVIETPPWLWDDDDIPDIVRPEMECEDETFTSESKWVETISILATFGEKAID